MFPVITIALVPIRLLLMRKMWHRETLRFVDSWACRDGTPEDEEDRLDSIEDPPRTTKGGSARDEVEKEKV